MFRKVRSFIQNVGLARVVSPWVSRWEDWKLAKFGEFQPERVSAEMARIKYGSGETFSMGPPTHFADMACSRHELPTLVACLNICAGILRGAVAWDVGGNAGFYSAVMGHLTGVSGKVYAFEPVPSTFAFMCENLRTAACTNVTPVNLALSDQDGQLPISFDPSDNQVSSLEVKAGDRSADVRVARGDRLVESGECEAPAMVKMDIEGHELKALRGMTGILSRPECRAVVCEIHFGIMRSTGESAPAAKAKRLLREAGFKHCGFISRSHLMATKERVG
jgi:FkbM family methyltransferase